MIKKSSLLIIALLLLAVGAGCARPASAPAPKSDAAAASGGAVAIKDFAFLPPALTVKTGATVVWTNGDSAWHTVKSSLFESPRLAKGQSFQYIFNQAGTYNYICGLHPSMSGQIIVQP